MRAVEIAVIGSENNDCIRGELESIELFENSCDVTIHVSQAVKIEIVSLAPTPFFLSGNSADQGVVGFDEIGVGTWSAWSIEPL